MLDANLSLLEVLLCSPLDCWCPISLLCLTFDEVNDCAWDLSNITSLKVMSVVGTIWTCLADCHLSVLEGDGDLGFAEGGVSLASLPSLLYRQLRLF